ncbi:MAG: GlsB/YeaQ/YmgE family stress response membrane protein [Chloroflexota bacterium]
MGIISWLVVGAIAGYVAGYLVKGDESLGVIGHVVLGIVGAIVGGFVASVLTNGKDYVTGINIVSIVVAIIGAVIAVVAYKMLTRRTPTGGGPL